MAIALPILLLGIGEALARDNTGRWLTAAAVNGAAIAFRCCSPLIALVAVVAVQGLAHYASYDTDPLSPFLAELILMFTVAYQLRLKPALLGYAIGVVYVVIDFASGRIDQIVQAGAQAGFYLLAWGIGRILRGQEERRAAAERHVVRVELEREEQARSAVVEERARIARELHDVVSHSLGVMLVQAEAADAIAEPGDARVRERLGRIRSSGRDALGDMRRMLGLLRDDDADLDAEPQPGTARLPELLEWVSATGLQVELRVEGDPPPLAPERGPRALPDRAGGAHEHAQARAREPRRRADPLHR